MSDENEVKRNESEINIRQHSHSSLAKILLLRALTTAYGGYVKKDMSGLKGDIVFTFSDGENTSVPLQKTLDLMVEDFNRCTRIAAKQYVSARMGAIEEAVVEAINQKLEPIEEDWVDWGDWPSSYEDD